MKPWLRTALYFCAAVVITALVSVVITRSVINNSTGERIVMTKEEYDELSDWFVLEELAERIDKEYYGDKVSRETMIEGAINGVLEAIDDPYSQYYSEGDYLKYLDKANGNYKGIGVLLAQPESKKGALILKVYEKSPAEEAGMMAGDELLMINETPVKDLSLEEVENLIAGEDDTAVHLTFMRGDEQMQTDVMRGSVKVSRVHHALFKEGTGYICIDMFRGDCVEEFEEALRDLKERGMRSLIIDLRNNPGGTLSSVVEITDMVIGEGIIVTVDDGSRDAQVYRSDNRKVQVPLAVLVNENSASASEILAGAVQDSETGIIVGTTTYGKGLVQTTSQLKSNDGWVKFTTAAYYTPDGRNINSTGIEPDIDVDLADNLKGLPIDQIEQDDDAQLWAALDYVRAQADELEENES